MPRFKPGDHVECILSTDEQNAHRESDTRKARKEGCKVFMGRAAAYMHTDEAYVVEALVKGGLRLRGFVPIVSMRDVRLSTKPTTDRVSWWLHPDARNFST